MSSGNWGWGGKELIRLMLETQNWVHWKCYGEKDRVGWGGVGEEAGRGQEVGVQPADQCPSSACLVVVCTGVTNHPVGT